jgi:hypothetical protein
VTRLSLRIFIHKASANAVEVAVPNAYIATITCVAYKGRRAAVVTACPAGRIAHLAVIGARLRVWMLIATAASTHLAQRIDVRQWAFHVDICVDPTFEPDGIGLDVPAYCWVVIPEVVVVRPGPASKYCPGNLKL